MKQLKTLKDLTKQCHQPISTLDVVTMQRVNRLQDWLEQVLISPMKKVYRWHNVSKRRKLIALIVLFNLLIVLGFVFSNLYIWNLLKTQVDQGIAYNGEGGYTIPYIEDFGLQISISHPFYENGTIANLGALPGAVPNYPFILFWVAIVGNLLFIWVLMKKEETEKSLH